MAKLSDAYGITGPKAGAVRSNLKGDRTKGPASSGAAKRDKGSKVGRTAGAVTPPEDGYRRSGSHFRDGVGNKTPLEPDALTDAGEKINVARSAVEGLAPASINFLMKITPAMDERLEVERARRGLRSRIATIMAILDGALK